MAPHAPGEGALKSALLAASIRRLTRQPDSPFRPTGSIRPGMAGMGVGDAEANFQAARGCFISLSDVIDSSISRYRTD